MAWTSPRTWVSGEVPTAANFNTHVRDNLKAIGDAWTSYTPTWTALTTPPAIGNGSVTGAYMQAGKLVHGRARILAGSTTTYGAGIYTVSLPVPALAVTLGVIGHGLINNTGTSSFYRFATLLTTSTIILRDPSAVDWTPTAPFTFGNTDFTEITFTYEAA